MLRYFAYGSNMLVGRIRQPDRAPSAVAAGLATLPGFRLQFNKRSLRDGSGKCNILSTRLPGDVVHGVLYQIAPGNRGGLDAPEGARRGYEQKQVEVLTASGWMSAFTYVAMRPYVNDTLSPYHWYKDLVVAGAEEHSLPAGYINRVRAVRSLADPDPTREEAVRMILAVATANRANRRSGEFQPEVTPFDLAGRLKGVGGEG